MTVNNESQNEGNASDLGESVSVLRLVFLSLIVITPVLTPGMTSTISSIALPQMELNMDEASWFGSITSIAWPFGSIFTGLIIDKYGRRISLLSSTVPSIVGWFLLADTNASLAQLYAGRALTGFALGACFLPSPVYLAECVTVNHVRIRSTIGTWSAFAMTIGGLLAYALSVFLPYDRIAFTAGILSTLSLFSILVFIPESPPWLYRKGRIGDAEAAQQRLGIKQSILRNRDVPLTSDSAVTTSAAVSVSKENSFDNFSRYLAQIGRREVHKPLIITSVFLFFGEFSGIYCLQSYMVDVIERTPSKLDPYLLSVIGQVAQIFGCLFLTLALPHSGVKTLSVVSFVGIAAGFMVLAGSLLFQRSSAPGDDANTILSYLPVASIWAIMSAGQLGVFAIPYAVLGEMFPMGAKGFASVSLFADSVFNFVVLKMFPYMLARYECSIFIVFGGICTCGAAFVALCLPETVGRTVDEIERDFERPTRT